MSKSKTRAEYNAERDRKDEMKKRWGIWCPVCGGPPNNMDFVHLFQGKVTYAVRCWSGDINKSRQSHTFLVHIKLPEDEVDLDQLKEAQARINELEEKLWEVDPDNPANTVIGEKAP